MAAPQGLATFPGLNQILSCTYTRSRGITPGLAMIECVPQKNFPAAGGDLVLSFGGAALPPIKGCIVDKQTIRINSQGMIWSLTLRDRRWKWNNTGQISGHYNIPFIGADGTPVPGSVDPAHEQDPQSLAILLLQAMGEPAFDVGDLPNATRPEVDWDYANPAKELDSLVNGLGCCLVLQLDDSVAVRVIGTGANLPTLDPLTDSLTINPPERPDSLKVVGKVRFQQDFDLEAVGLEADGSLVLIDDLSYAPGKPGTTDRWLTSDPPYFDVLDGVAAAGSVELAQKSVFKKYRIKITKDDDVTPIVILGSGGGVVADLSVLTLAQILPIEDEQVKQYTDTGDNKTKNEAALVFGIFYDGELSAANTAGGTDYQGEYTINKERGIVEFADYVYKLDGTGDFPLEADLSIRLAVGVRDPLLWAWIRYEKEAKYPVAFGTGPRILSHPEITLNYIDGVQQNFSDVDAEAGYYIAAADQEYQATFPQDISWPGLVAINPDGAISQVEWTVTTSPYASTRASRNTEFSLQTQPYPMRRIWEALRNGGLNLLLKGVKRLEQGQDQGR